MERVFILILVIFFGCSPKVIHFLNESAPYAGFNTYQVTNVKINNADISPTGQEIIKHIESSIIEEMKRRDYKPQKDPDLVVRYELISNQQTDVNVNNYGLYGPMYPYRTISVRTFLESALLIEIINLKTKKAIWHASVDMNNYRKEKKMDDIIQKAVTSIFNTYPYKAGSGQPDKSLIIE
ncbi:MAG: DUF4136 domain-containing protein [Cyclobacteriaceae bacterium]